MRGKDISDGAIAIMTKGMPVGAPIAGPMVLGLGLGFKIGLVLKFGFENLKSYCDLLDKVLLLAQVMCFFAVVPHIWVVRAVHQEFEPAQKPHRLLVLARRHPPQIAFKTKLKLDPNGNNQNGFSSFLVHLAIHGA